ncbi:MAG: hypothetical protein HYX95_03705 [Chloroflexi bacterium]|nr:hypothetical protein [Chloroflexota bacterium]
MRLELGTFPITELVPDNRTYLAGTILHVNNADLVKLVLEDERIEDVAIEVVRPGENARIVYVRDCVEPRIKVQGAGCVFPGFMGGVEVVGSGRTHRLEGIAVVESVRTPESWMRSIANSADSFLDMIGPAAISPFTRTINLVLCLTKMKEGLTPGEFANATQLAGLRVAARLAETTRGLEPPQMETYDDEPTAPSLPNALYVHMPVGVSIQDIQDRGLGSRARGPSYYGQPVTQNFRTFLHPTEFLDGAYVEDGWLPGSRLTTWENVNHPVVLDLLRRHGKDLNFVGAVITHIRYTTVKEKDTAAKQNAKLIKRLGANGAIFTWFREGNAFMDVVMTVEECEKLGVKTVLVTRERNGDKGDQPPLLFYSTYMKGIVTTANDGIVRAPAVERVVGGDVLWLKPESHDSPIPASGSFDAQLGSMGNLHCAGDYYGFNRLRCYEY